MPRLLRQELSGGGRIKEAEEAVRPRVIWCDSVGTWHLSGRQSLACSQKVGFATAVLSELRWLSISTIMPLRVRNLMAQMKRS